MQTCAVFFLQCAAWEQKSWCWCGSYHVLPTEPTDHFRQFHNVARAITRRRLKNIILFFFSQKKMLLPFSPISVYRLDVRRPSWYGCSDVELDVGITCMYEVPRVTLTFLTHLCIQARCGATCRAWSRGSIKFNVVYNVLLTLSFNIPCHSSKN